MKSCFVTTLRLGHGMPHKNLCNVCFTHKFPHSLKTLFSFTPKDSSFPKDA